MTSDEITPLSESVREDYAKLHFAHSGPHHQGQTSQQAQEALREIDRLRAENEALRVDLAWANRRIDDMEATIDRLSVTWELP